MNKHFTLSNKEELQLKMLQTQSEQILVRKILLDIKEARYLTNLALEKAYEAKKFTEALKVKNASGEPIHAGEWLRLEAYELEMEDIEKRHDEIIKRIPGFQGVNNGSC